MPSYSNSLLFVLASSLALVRGEEFCDTSSVAGTTGTYKYSVAGCRGLNTLYAALKETMENATASGAGGSTASGAGGSTSSDTNTILYVGFSFVALLLVANILLTKHFVRQEFASLTQHSMHTKPNKVLPSQVVVEHHTGSSSST